MQARDAEIVLFRLRGERERVLQRVQASIADMEDVLRGMDSSCPRRVVVVALLDRLRATEARIEANV